jgi:hypothetical protein
VLEPARDYFRLANRVSFDDFARDLDVNVFLVSPYGEKKDKTSKFETVSGLGSGVGGTHKLARIQKSGTGGNAFDFMITIGRTENNDITLVSAQVSKFHAFVVEEGGAVMFCDAGSSNGTSIEGEKLEDRVRTRLECGTKVLLADQIELTFYTPSGLYNHLRSVGFLL